MNAKQLLEILKTGATVREMWKPRTWQSPRRICVLQYADGRTERIQHSTLNALIGTNEVICEAWVGDRYVYRARS